MASPERPRELALVDRHRQPGLVELLRELLRLSPGLRVVLGTDGGAVCQNPANSLGKAILNAELTNGASFVGRRPVLVAKRVVQGELLILQTYCPENVPAFVHKINGLKFKNTIKR